MDSKYVLLFSSFLLLLVTYDAESRTIVDAIDEAINLVQKSLKATDPPKKPAKPLKDATHQQQPNNGSTEKPYKKKEEGQKPGEVKGKQEGPNPKVVEQKGKPAEGPDPKVIERKVQEIIETIKGHYKTVKKDEKKAEGAAGQESNKENEVAIKQGGEKPKKQKKPKKQPKERTEERKEDKKEGENKPREKRSVARRLKPDAANDASALDVEREQELPNNEDSSFEDPSKLASDGDGSSSSALDSMPPAELLKGQGLIFGEDDVEFDSVLTSTTVEPSIKAP